MATPAEISSKVESDVQAALDEQDPQARRRRLIETITAAFLIAWDDETPEGADASAATAAFLASMSSMMTQTHPDQSDGQAQRIADIIGVAAVNGAQVAAHPGARKTWRTMRDDAVRDLHRPMEGVTIAAGDTFDVGGHHLLYPGQPVGPPEVWINCRCTLTASAVTAAADAPSGVVVVARPSDGALAVPGGLPADELHVTLGYYGDAVNAPPGLRSTLEQFMRSNPMTPHEARVGGVAQLGDDDPPATVLMLESEELKRLRAALETYAQPDQTHPHFTPHMTLGYGIDAPDAVPASVGLDGLELWWAGERTPGGDMGSQKPASDDTSNVAQGDVSYDAAVIAAPMGSYGDKVDGKCPEGKHMMPDGSCMDDDDPEMTAAVSEEPWSNFSASDYSIQQWRKACLIKMPGGDPEAKSTYKVPVRTPTGALSRAGVHAAAAALAGARGGVDAPASEKAKARRALIGLYRQLGDEPPDSLKADGELDEPVSPTATTSATGTRDGPGWLTNPRDTQRLRDYWTRGAGAGKIRWGQPGDFNRCRSQLAKYVSNPQYLAGTCANLHYVALGFWPSTHAAKGRHAAAPPDTIPAFDPDFDTEEFAAVTAAFTAADAATTELPPREWFENPGLDAVTPLTVTDDGRVIGHLAPWGTCHVGVSGACTEAPRSMHDYAYFRTGEAITDGGPVPVGQITMDTGHAGTDLGASAAVSHYDDTGTVVADVAAGEDEFGIWVAGAARPGVTEAQMRSLRAGALSGDWRRIGGNLELVAALVVNVPGFPIPRTQVASAGGQAISLVAAAVVTVDPNALDAERVAVAVLAAMDQRVLDKARQERAAALTADITDLRVGALAAAVEG